MPLNANMLFFLEKLLLNAVNRLKVINNSVKSAIFKLYKSLFTKRLQN